MRKRADRPRWRALPALALLLGTGAAAEPVGGHELSLERLRREPHVPHMAALLARPDDWDLLLELLPRYQSAELTAATRRVLARAQSPAIAQAAMMGLIAQLDDAPPTRQIMGRHLTHADPRLADLAAEYFRRLGHPDDVPRLRWSLERVEQDIIKASIMAALEAMERRRNTDAHVEAAPAREIDGSLRAALQALRQAPSPSLRERARALLREQSGFVPYFRYAGDRRQGLLTPEEQLRQDLFLLAVAPPVEERPTTSMVPLTPAGAWLPPLMAYFDDKRHSFGFRVPDDDAVYPGRIHVGDDAGWKQTFQSVRAVGHGIVRCAAPSLPSWGGLVIIEHRDMDGTPICSLYGHLDPFLAVTTGQTIEAGQKIGVLGRGFTRENGGYGTHLHFGLRQGEYNWGEWVTGYLHEQYGGEPDLQGWVDPQSFLRKRVHP